MQIDILVKHISFKFLAFENRTNLIKLQRGNSSISKEKKIHIECIQSEFDGGFLQF